MTSLPLLLLLIFCVPLHACTPRPLTKKDTANYYYTDKELDNVKLLETFNTLSVKEYNKLKENPTQQQKVANNEINTCVNCNSASTLKQVIVGSSSQTDSSSLHAAKDEKGHTRSMLGPARHHVEETMVTNSNDNGDDIVEMDYAQPHRKPPIHNEKP